MCNTTIQNFLRQGFNGAGQHPRSFGFNAGNSNIDLDISFYLCLKGRTGLPFSFQIKELFTKSILQEEEEKKEEKGRLHSIHYQGQSDYVIRI